MKKNIILIGNGPFQNRGCEAITRGILELTASLNIDKYYICNFTNSNKDDMSDPRVIELPINISRYSANWFIYHLTRCFGIKKIYFPHLKNIYSSAKLILAIGGDNYSMDYNSLRVHLDVIEHAKRNGMKLIIYGGSIGPFNRKGIKYESMIINILRRVDYFIVRESETYNYLISRGLNNIYVAMDPAFLLKPIKPEIDKNYNNYIGINFSPLVANLIGNEKTIRVLYRTIEYLTSQKKYKILLIPHALKTTSSDFVYLQSMLSTLDNDKVELLDSRNLSASQIKWIISNLHIFIGARMHSVVAAISTAVPCLSISYSIKSKGLIKDIFDNDNYYLDINDFTYQLLIDKINYILDNHSKIKSYLITQSEAFEAKAREANNIISKFINLDN